MLVHISAILDCKFVFDSAKTFEMLTVAFAESTMSRTQVQLWYNRFKKDREDGNDDAVKKMIFG